MFSTGERRNSADGKSDGASPLSLPPPPKFIQDLQNQLPSLPLPGPFANLVPSSGDDASGQHQDRLTLAWAISDGINNKRWEERWSALQRPDKPRVLILMSETGGGHKASAQSIGEALEAIAPGQLQVSIVDVFVDHTGFPFNRFPKMYQWFSSKPTVWDAVYKTSKYTSDSILGWEEPLALAWDSDFQKCIEQENPDIIVSVHPLCQDPVARVVRRVGKWKAGRKVPFVTCITDLGEGHPFWFHVDVDRCYVPGEAVRSDGLRHGLREDQMAMKGLPIRKGFWEVDTSDANVARLRGELGLKACRTVLVVGGGDGMGGLLSVAQHVGKAIASETEERQMVVVCGKNVEVRAKLEKGPWHPNR